jgi:hypothetical protein
VPELFHLLLSASFRFTYASALFTASVSIRPTGVNDGPDGMSYGKDQVSTFERLHVVLKCSNERYLCEMLSTRGLQPMAAALVFITNSLEPRTPP